LFPREKYTPAELSAIAAWLSALESADLKSINAHLATRTTVLGSKPSVADLATYAVTAPQVASLDSDARTGEEGVHHVVRHVAFVQGAPMFGIAGSDKVPEEELVRVDLDDVKALPKAVKPAAKGAEEGKKGKEKKEKKDKKGDVPAAGTAG
ncbi:G4 quadruplex nucleic acid binding protein, partial [Ascosphaera pollenicola]